MHHDDICLCFCFEFMINSSSWCVVHVCANMFLSEGKWILLDVRVCI